MKDIAIDHSATKDMTHTSSQHPQRTLPQSADTTHTDVRVSVEDQIATKIRNIALATNYIISRLDTHNVVAGRFIDEVVESTVFLTHTAAAYRCDATLVSSHELLSKMEVLEMSLKTLVATGTLKGHFFTVLREYIRATKTLLRSGHMLKDSARDSSVSEALSVFLADGEGEFDPDTQKRFPQGTPLSTGAVRLSRVKGRNSASLRRTTQSPERTHERFSERAEAVYEFIRTHGTVGIPHIASQFREVSSKTIQRELVGLLAAGRIEKEGDRRWTKYRVHEKGLSERGAAVGGGDSVSNQ